MLENHQCPEYRWLDSLALKLQVGCPHPLALPSHHPSPFALDNHVALEAGFLQILLLLHTPEGTLDPPLKPALLDLPLVRLC